MKRKFTRGTKLYKGWKKNGGAGCTLMERENINKKLLLAIGKKSIKKTCQTIETADKIQVDCYKWERNGEKKKIVNNE